VFLFFLLNVVVFHASIKIIFIPSAGAYFQKKWAGLPARCLQNGMQRGMPIPFFKRR